MKSKYKMVISGVNAKFIGDIYEMVDVCDGVVESVTREDSMEASKKSKRSPLKQPKMTANSIVYLGESTGTVRPVDREVFIRVIEPAINKAGKGIPRQQLVTMISAQIKHINSVQAGRIMSNLYAKGWIKM